MNVYSHDTARILSEFSADLRAEMIPDQAVETARMYIADYVAACFAGIKVNRSFNDAIFGIVNSTSFASPRTRSASCARFSR